MAAVTLFGSTADGHDLELLHVVDEFSPRRWRSSAAVGSLPITVRVLHRLVAERSTPGFIRCDKGPEMTAKRGHGLLLVLERRERLH